MEHGSTFYIGIAIVILPYFGPMGKLKYQFSVSFSTQFDIYVLHYPLSHFLIFYFMPVKAHPIRVII